MAYLTQEYSNECWQLQHAADMMAQAATVKLEWLGTATLPEVFEALMPAEIQALIAEERDPVLRESLRDIALCQAFRRDLYVKGRGPLWAAERTRRWSRCGWWLRPSTDSPVRNPKATRTESASTLASVGSKWTAAGARRCSTTWARRARRWESCIKALVKGALPDTVQLISMMLFSGWPALHDDTATGAALLNRAIIRAVCAARAAPAPRGALPR